jgi:hypothetical protein
MIYMFIDMLTRDLTDGLWDIFDLGIQPSKAQKNPESYVFFIAHMFHLGGIADGDEPWSIKKNWDFKLDLPRLFVAVEP